MISISPASGRRDRCLQTVFEQQVERSPSAIAIEQEGDVATFRDLNGWANQVAHYLQRRSIGPETVVGLSMAADLELFIVLLGVLKAGAAVLYLPSAAPSPWEQMAFMLRDAAVVLIVVDRPQQLEELPPSGAATVCLHRDWKAMRQESQENPLMTAMPESLAAVIYTLDSTGMPKRVLVEHQELGYLAEGIIGDMDLLPHDRILQFFSPGSDAFVFELVLSLSHGASLHVVPEAARNEPPALDAFLRRSAITVATLTPSVLAELPRVDLPALRKLIVVGETCPTELIGRWRAPGRRIFRAKGQRAAVMWTSFSECRDDG